MATNDFQIEIIEQGWLEGSSPEEDLCSHGKIKLTIGGHSITSGHEDYGISESALALYARWNPTIHRISLWLSA
jgi:hypothetical protein